MKLLVNVFLLAAMLVCFVYASQGKGPYQYEALCNSSAVSSLHGVHSLETYI